MPEVGGGELARQEPHHNRQTDLQASVDFSGVHFGPILLRSTSYSFKYLLGGNGSMSGVGCVHKHLCPKRLDPECRSPRFASLHGRCACCRMQPWKALREVKTRPMDDLFFIGASVAPCLKDVRGEYSGQDRIDRPTDRPGRPAAWMDRPYRRHRFAQEKGCNDRPSGISYRTSADCHQTPETLL
jgi:hypothetical protein